MDFATTPETAFLATVVPYATVGVAVVVIVFAVWCTMTGALSDSTRRGLALVAAGGFCVLAEPLALAWIGA